VNKDAAITGDVVVASGGGVVLNRNAGLAASSNLTLGREALLATGSTTPTFSGVITSNGGQIILANTAGLTFNNPGTGLVFNGGLLTQSSTAAGTVNLLTNLSYASSSELQAVIQRFNTGGFNFNLNTGASVGNAERTFAIADSNTLAADQAEMVVDNIISNGGSGSTTGSIRKTGDGTLQFTAANTFTGGLVIDAGTVQLGRIQAAAQSGLTATFTNSGNEADVLTFTSPITGGMVVGQAVTGTGVATGRIIAGILNEYQVMLNGTGGTNNAVATDISVGAVDRIGSLASAVTVNGGTLLLDGGTSVNNTVTVNTGGILAGTGTITGATGITGSLRPGHSIGTLTVTNDVTWNSSAVVADAWVFELGTAAIDQATAASGGSTQDVLDITGDFLQGTPGNAWTFDFAGTGSEGWYKLVNWTGTTGFVAGDFTATNLGGSLSGSFEIDGGSLYLAVIPEPGTLTLVGVAMLSLLAFRRRK
jgi:autotransporter-associated beta strand protein